MSNLVKKALLFSSIVFSCFFISNYALANGNNMMDSMHNGMNDVRNVVGGAENAVENGVKDSATTVKDGLEDMGNSAQNVMRDSEYSASRTATDDTTRANIMNTTNNNNLWTWLIVGAVALVIIGIIWYMVARNNNSNQ